MGLHPRTEVPLEDRWNVEAFYPDLTSWEKEFNQIITKDKPPFFPQLSTDKGKLIEGPEKVKNSLAEIIALDRTLSKLYTYAHLKHDEDIADHIYKTAYNKITAYLHYFIQESAWFEPELLSLPEKVLETYLESDILQEYHFHLEKIIRLKQHTLSLESEELLALAGQALQVPHKAFSAINDADFKFGRVLDGKEQEREITHASYGLFLRDRDRTLRKNAFLTYHHKYEAYENTLCELLNGQIQNHAFNARARKYGSSLEAALFPKNIDPSVYHALIQAVNEEIGALHKYIDLRQKVLELDSLHLYDMYVPLISQIEMNLPYPQGQEMVVNSSKPLGEEYQKILRRGLEEDRWVDRYENLNKRSGAYSSGCYDSMPYILMNYKEQLRDVFTLAHEAGHSMHSFYSKKYQPYQYSQYPIFLAEVASTFNEDLLTNYLLENAQTVQEKIYLINQKIEDLRTTLFRQTMFAEFELLIHQMVENNQPLTPLVLKTEYRKLNQKYFGPHVVIDREAEMEWARIPHFYYNFYVYQYATGISAALALSERVTKGGEKERQEYLDFLKAGCSDYPINILKKAGIDMRSPEPVKAAIRKFSQLVDQLETLLPETLANNKR